MIEINITYQNSKFTSIEIKGHSDKLICAGISSIFVGMMNAIEYKNYKISLKSGDSYCKLIKDMSNEDEIKLNSMLIQLQTIQEKYPKEVIINKKGE